MMPSRGAQLGLRALRISQRPVAHASRTFSSGPARPLILSSFLRQNAFGLSQEQRRNFSWNPLDWTKSAPSPEQSAATQNVAQSTSAAAQKAPEAVVVPQKIEVANNTSSSAATSSAAPTPTSLEPVDVNLDSVTALTPAGEEHIGYLHSLGLDYGWGPTSMVQWLLEHIHVYTGMPWWLSIMATAVVIRASFIPLTIKMSDSQARMAHIKPVLDPLNKKLAETVRNKDTLAMAKVRMEINDMRKRSGFSLKWMGLSMGFNTVFAYCSFKLVRAMTLLPVPGLLNGGTLWFQNLTLADPYYIIPGLMAGGMHLAVRYGAETGGVDPYANQPGMRSIMLYFLPAIIWVSGAFFSSALTLWMTAGGLVTIVIGRLLLNPSVRQSLGITLMPTQTPGSMPTIANFFRDEIAEQEATQPPPSARVLDVKGTRTSPGQMTYQAPRLNRSKFSAAPPSSYPDPSSAVAPTAQGTVQAAVPSPPQPEKHVLERYVEWASSRVNDVGEGYALIGRKAKSLMKQASGQAKDSLPASKTKSKDYLKKAQEYERRYEQEKRRGWR